MLVLSSIGLNIRGFPGDVMRDWLINGDNSRIFYEMVDSMIYVLVYRAQRLSSSINAVAPDLASMQLVPTRCEAIPFQRGLFDRLH